MSPRSTPVLFGSALSTPMSLVVPGIATFRNAGLLGQLSRSLNQGLAALLAHCLPRCACGVPDRSPVHRLAGQVFGLWAC